MKRPKLAKGLLFCLVLISSFTSASSVSLTENSTWQANLTAVYHSSLVFGDVDNDGDLDLALTGEEEGGSVIAKIYIKNGISLTENSTWQANLTGINRGSLAFGDIDNDADLDLVLVGCGSGGGYALVCNTFINRIYINNGTSLIENSTWQQNLTGANIYGGSIAFGDVNNDGRLDLVVAGADAAGKNGVYINNGTSLIKNSTWLQSLSYTGQAMGKASIALGDIDDDNDLDLIFLGSYSTDFYSKVYVNNGTSLVEDSTWEQNLYTVGYPDLTLGDYDNDADLDLVYIGAAAGDHFYIFHNNGNTFIENQTEGGGGNVVGLLDGSISWGDYDNDGDLDLAANGREEYTDIYDNTNIFRNDQTVSDSLLNLKFSSIVWVDIDNDGDLDLIETGQSSNVPQALIYTNTITTPNTAPNPPSTFTSSFANNQLTLTWNNGSDTETPTLGLYYNLRVGTNSSGHQIVSGVYGGGDDNGYFGNMMQRKSISLNIQNQTYYWAAQTIDTGLKAGSWSREQRYPLDTTNPSITANSPANNTNSSNLTIIFNATASDDIRLENVTLFANFSGAYQENETNTSGTNNSIYLFTKNIADGTYIWSIRACGYYGSNCTFSENRTIMIDATYPIVTILAPLNNSLLETSNITVRAQFSDSNIVNCQVRNDSGSWYNMDNDGATSGTANYTFIGLSSANHNLTINCSDILLSTIKTINFTVDTSAQDTTKPNIAITSPLNNSYLSSSTVTVNVNFNDSTNTNCQAKIDTNSWQNMDNDGATSGIANYTFTSITDGNHSINVNCTDSNNNNATTNVSFVVDTTYPVITLISPSNASTWTSSSTVDFYYNVTDVVIDNCSLIINNDKLVNDTTITINASQSFSRSLSNAVYNWSVNCTDKAGNENNSITRQITVSYSAPSTGGGGGGGSSGGGGGGGSAPASEVNLDNKAEFKSETGIILKQTQNDKAKFTLEKKEYIVEIAKLKEDSVTIDVAGASTVFRTGDSKQFDVNNDGSKDISITLNEISGGRAEIVYKMLVKPEEKPIVEEEKVEKEELKPIIEEKIEEKESKVWMRLLIGLGSLLVGLIIGYFYIKRKR